MAYIYFLLIEEIVEMLIKYLVAEDIIDADVVQVMIAGVMNRDQFTGGVGV